MARGNSTSTTARAAATGGGRTRAYQNSSAGGRHRGTLRLMAVSQTDHGSNRGTTQALSALMTVGLPGARDAKQATVRAGWREVASLFRLTLARGLP